MALWAGAFLISMTWLYSVHVHLYANYWATAALTLAGVITFALALRKKVDLSSTSRAWGLLIIPLAVGFLILGFPRSLGPGLLILGLCGLLLCRSYAKMSAIAASLLLSGAILTLQGVTFPLYFNYVAKHPHVPFLSSVIYPILRYCGLRASISDGVIYIQTMRNLWPFPTSWAGLGLLPLLQLCVASVVVITVFGGEPRKGARVLWQFIIGMGYMIVRYALMLLLFTYLMYFVGYFDDVLWIDLFWNRAVAFLSFIPLVLILAKAFPLQRTGETIIAGLQLDHFSTLDHIRKGIAVLAVALGVFFFVAYQGFQDPGKLKEGRILLDEKHSDWEKSDRKYDTKWYGNESGYNYWSMSDFLSYYYTIDKNEDKDLTSSLLKNYDVVLLKNPTYPYSKKEVKALVGFVEDGGGVFLMGEHTNVFGTSVPLNTVGRHFGFFFRYDSVFDMEKKFEQLWHVPKLMPSPIVHNQKKFLFATSCSIEPLSYFGRTRNAAVAGGLWSLPIEYASGNFYPQADLRTDMTFGPLIQMITATYGKGRAIGFSDSTTFSNFSAHLPGKSDMLLSSMNWLNRENRFSFLNGVFLVLSVLCFAGAFAVTYGTPRHHGTRFAAIAVGVCAGAVAMWAFTFFTHLSYPLPEPEREVPKVVFEKQYSEYEIPISGFVKDQQKSFAIFYQWVLRLQYFPFLTDTLDQAIAKEPHILVMINPTNITPPGRDFVDHADAENIHQNVIPKLRKYLNSGGKLLLMDDVENENSMSNMILGAFGMRLDAGYRRPGRQAAMTELLNAEDKAVCSVPSGYSISGGEPLMTTLDKKVVLARKRVGKGVLLVMSASKRFCDSRMGLSQSQKPRSADTIKAFYLQFAILRGLMKDKLDEELLQIDDKLLEVGIE